MSGIFYGQDTCDKSSNQASINEKWLHSWIFLLNEHLYYWVEYQCHISKTFEGRKWIKLYKFAVNVR